MRSPLLRQQLCDTAAADYNSTARWSLVIHQSRPDAQGLIWTSKRCDPQQAVLLFGDRVAETDLNGMSNVPVYPDVGEMRQVASFAARVDITLVL
ncbi:RES domain-containing protein [Phyllobacterium endophyticum]|uniref:RES domain-containing protein n=1 Tax=Phyllobacterium endophyticum TaxID=1149773 RepID=UPI0011C9965F|nr:RES domain-containing protein [Phyllobacterium endophyticum]TXR47058.1 RES domain-containing protein [Phyllobacterium endophyticum]